MPILTFQEKVDLSILNKILNFCKLDQDIRNRLLAYRKLVNKGYVTVKYSPKNYEHGRVYADKSLSLQNFKKVIRHTLAREIYHDIDIENAHPVLLEQICAKNGWPCEALSKYNKNREKHLKDIMEKCEVDRGAAKDLIIRILYLGSIKQWMQDEIVTEYPPNFLNVLKKELGNIASKVWSQEKKLVEAVEKLDDKKNKKSTVLSWKMQGIEHQILMKNFW